MSTQQHDREEPQSSPDPDLEEREVLQYLRAHPDFFRRHASLTAQLEVPHECGKAVSLVEYQVKVLRNQNRQMKTKLKELVQVGRENDRLNERMLKLTVGLLQAGTLPETVTLIEHTLREEFNADAVALWLFARGGQLDRDAGPARCIDRDDDQLVLFESFLKTGRPLCGRLKGDQLEFLFGDHALGIGSAAVLGLQGNGFLAIGSTEEARFHPGMGTVFLNRLGQLIGGALTRYLAPAAHG